MDRLILAIFVVTGIYLSLGFSIAQELPNAGIPISLTLPGLSEFTIPGDPEFSISLQASITNESQQGMDKIVVHFAIVEGTGNLEEGNLARKITDHSGMVTALFGPDNKEGKTVIEVSLPVYPQIKPMKYTIVKTYFIKPALRIHSGNNQTGFLRRSLPKPLIVKVVDTNHEESPLGGLEVEFEVVSGNCFPIADSRIDTKSDTNGLAGINVHLSDTEARIRASIELKRDQEVNFTVHGVVPELKPWLGKLYMPRVSCSKTGTTQVEGLIVGTKAPLFGVQVTDWEGKGAPDIDVLWQPVIWNKASSFSEKTIMTDASGNAYCWLPFEKPGEYTMRASIPEFPEVAPVEFMVKRERIANNTYEPGNIQHIIERALPLVCLVKTGHEQIGTTDEKLAIPLTVELRNKFGEIPWDKNDVEAELKKWYDKFRISKVEWSYNFHMRFEVTEGNAAFVKPENIASFSDEALSPPPSTKTPEEKLWTVTGKIEESPEGKKEPAPISYPVDNRGIYMAEFVYGKNPRHPVMVRASLNGYWTWRLYYHDSKLSRSIADILQPCYSYQAKECCFRIDPIEVDLLEETFPGSGKFERSGTISTWDLYEQEISRARRYHIETKVPLNTAAIRGGIVSFDSSQQKLDFIVNAIGKVSPEDLVFELKKIVPDRYAIYWTKQPLIFISRIMPLDQDEECPPNLPPSYNYIQMPADGFSAPTVIVGEKKAPQPEEVMAAITKSLKHYNRRVRYDAAKKLESMGKAALPALPALIEALKDKDWRVQQGVKDAISGIGEAAIPSLLEILKDENWYARKEREELNRHNRFRDFHYAESTDERREAAKEILASMGEIALPMLLQNLREQRKGFELVLPEVLGTMGENAGEAIPQLKALLTSQNKHIRIAAANALANIGKKAEQAIHELVQTLRDPDQEVSNAAKEALGKLSEHAVPLLIPVLQDPLDHVRYNTADALRMIGEEAKDAVPTLVQALQDSSPLVRVYSLRALAEIVEDPATLVPFLIPALRDQEIKVREIVLSILQEVKEDEVCDAIPELIPLLKDSSRYSIILQDNTMDSILNWTLKSMGKKAIPFLAQALTNPDPSIKISAATFFEHQGTKAIEAIPALIRAMQDPDVSIKKSAITALGNIGRETAEAVPALTEALKDQNSEIRDAAMIALGKIGGPAQSSVPELFLLLKDAKPWVKCNILQTLGKMPGQAREVERLLLELIQNPSAEILLKGNGLKIMGELEEITIAAIPLLTLMLKDKNPYLRCEVVKVLGRMKEHTAVTVPLLMQALQYPEPTLQRTAIKILGNMGEQAAAAIPDLVRLFIEQDLWEEQEAAAEALQKLNGWDKAIEKIPNLIQSLQNKNFKIRTRSARALSILGEKAESATPALIQALKDPAWDVREEAAHALRKINKQTVDAIPALVYVIHDKYTSVACEAVETLGNMGERAEVAIPILIEALKNNRRLRGRAAIALSKMGQKGKLAAPFIIKLFKSDIADDRKQAIEAVGRMQEKSAIPYLIGLLRSDNGADAAEALGNIGEIAPKEVMPHLQRALRSRNLRVREAVVRAIQKINNK